MECQLIEVGQLHIIAVDVAQQRVALVGHRQQMAFEGDMPQRIEEIGIAAAMIGDAHAQSMHAAWQAAGDKAEERIDEACVEAIEHDGPFEGSVVLRVDAADFIDVAKGTFREPMKPDGMTLYGKDVDIDTTVVAATVVGQTLVKKGVAVAQLGIAEDEVGVLLMRLEGKP